MDIDLFDFISNQRNEEFSTIICELSSQMDTFNFHRILNRKNANKYTLLHYAILNRNIEAVKVLVKFEADANIKCFGTPCIHLIARSVMLPNQDTDIWLEIFVSLIKVSEISSRDDQGFTILHLLCEFDLINYLKAVHEVASKEIFNILLENKDRLGYRPIHKAASGNSQQCLNFICTFPSLQLSSQTLAGETALHICAMKKCKIAFKILSDYLESTGNTDVLQLKDRYGRTPLEICSCDEWNPFNINDTSNSNSDIKTTAIISHPLCLKHSTCVPSKFEQATNQSPPENSKRLHVLIDLQDGALRSLELNQTELLWIESRKAAIADVLRVHDWTYVKRLQHTCSQIPPNIESSSGIAHLDGDTAVSNMSFIAALHACGAVCDGVDLVVQKKIRNVFCCVRPPGHHAGPRGVVKATEDSPESHGFCLLNNASIGAGYALNVYRDKIKRVAIVDFDVHHGNGTEETVRYLQPKLEKSETLNPNCFGTLYSPVYKPWLDDSDSSNVLFVSCHGFGARERELEFLMPKSAFYPGSGPTQYPHDDDLLPRVGICNNKKMQEFVGDVVYDDDDDDESYNCNDSDENDEASDTVDHSKIMSSVESMKAVYESATLLNESSNPSKMSSPLILDIGIGLPPIDSIDDGGLSYRFSWREKWRNEIFPRLIKFRPDLIIISAGFDGHRKDLINSGYLSLVEEDFSWLTERLVQVANTCCDGRIVSALEGGYMLGGDHCSSFAKSVKAHVSALATGAKSKQMYNTDFETIDKDFENKYISDTISRRVSKIQSQQQHDESMTSVILSQDAIINPVCTPDESTLKVKRRRSDVNYALLDKELSLKEN